MITSSSRSYFAVHSFNAHYGDWLTHIKRKPNCVVVESCLYDDWEDGITPPYIPSVVKPSSQINERTHSDSYPKKYCDCLIPKFIHKRLFAIARAGIAEIKGVSASLASWLWVYTSTWGNWSWGACKDRQSFTGSNPKLRFIVVRIISDCRAVFPNFLKGIFL